jgi:hypothetical protein
MTLLRLVNIVSQPVGGGAMIAGFERRVEFRNDLAESGEGMRPLPSWSGTHVAA